MTIRPRSAAYDVGVLLDVGEESVPRDIINSQAVTSASGTLRLSFFTARKSATVTTIAKWSGTTLAAATPTLCRMGIYLVDLVGNLTLIASTPNDTTLFAGASTAYPKAFSASALVQAGRRYAEGALVVTAAAAPTLMGFISNGTAAEQGVAPRISGVVTSLADLPATIAVGAIGDSGSRPFGLIS